MSLKRRIFVFFPSFCVFGLILYLSFASPSDLKTLPKVVISDKVVHFCMYFGLTVVFLYDLWRYKKSRFLSDGFLLPYLLLPIVASGVVELAQERFFSPRSAEWLDFFANTAGILSAYGLMSLFFIIKDRSSKLD